MQGSVADGLGLAACRAPGSVTARWRLVVTGLAILACWLGALRGALGAGDASPAPLRVWLIGFEHPAPPDQQLPLSREQPGTAHVRVLNLVPDSPFYPESSGFSSQHGDMESFIRSQRTVIGVVEDLAAKRDLRVELAILRWETAYRHLHDAFRAGTPPDICEVGSSWRAELCARDPRGEASIPFREDYRLFFYSLDPAASPDAGAGGVEAAWDTQGWESFFRCVTSRNGKIWFPYDRQGANILHDAFLMYWMGGGPWPDEGGAVPQFVAGSTLDLAVVRSLLAAPERFVVDAIAEANVAATLLKYPGRGCFRPVSAANNLYEDLHQITNAVFARHIDVVCPPTTFRGGSSLVVSGNRYPVARDFARALAADGALCRAMAQCGDVPAGLSAGEYAGTIRALWADREQGVASPFHERLIAAVDQARFNNRMYPPIAEMAAIERDPAVRNDLIAFWAALHDVTQAMVSPAEAEPAIVAALTSLQDRLRRHLQPGVIDWMRSPVLLLAVLSVFFALAAVLLGFWHREAQRLKQAERERRQAEEDDRINRNLAVRNVLGHQAPLRNIPAILDDLPRLLRGPGLAPLVVASADGVAAELRILSKATRAVQDTHAQLLDVVMRGGGRLPDEHWHALSCLVVRSIEAAADMCYLRTLECRENPPRLAARLWRPAAAGDVDPTSAGFAGEVRVEGGSDERKRFTWRCRLEIPRDVRIEQSQDAALLALALQEWFYNGFKALDSAEVSAGAEDGEVEASVAFDRASETLAIVTPPAIPDDQPKRLTEIEPEEPGAHATRGRGLYIMNRILLALGCSAGLACERVPDRQGNVTHTRLVLLLGAIVRPTPHPRRTARSAS